ncbi:hypothetical protein ABEB36_004280 [Hypothenemus hampei]|uniref:Cytochrome P450 n=1 Tax=Hypothenemus hampei TaxID=57062 RepID=A0ABD1F2V0_HYPHA
MIFTNDVIVTSAFELKVDSLEEPNNTFYTMGKDIINFSSLLATLKLMILFGFPKILKLIDIFFAHNKTTEYFHNTITETIKVREEKNIERKDMINLLLEARKGHKTEEDNAIETEYVTVQEDSYFDRCENLLFFVAGFDTVSIALCCGAQELAVNKDIQDRLREEIRETDKLNDGKLYLRCIIKYEIYGHEILKKWPPILVTDRLCTMPYTIDPKYPDEKPLHLKVNDILWLPISALRTDEKYLPKPEVFDPKRFSNKNCDQIIP